MLKKFKTWGAGLGIYFNKDEIENYNLFKGKLIELNESVFKNEKKQKQKKVNSNRY